MARQSEGTELQPFTVNGQPEFFCQYFGYTDNPVLAPIAQDRCRCQRYFHDSDHIHCCNRHSANWYRAHDHMLNAFRGICQEAGYVTDVKKVMTSEMERRADIAIFGIGVLQHTDLLADATVRHDFIGAGRDGGQRHGESLKILENRDALQPGVVSRMRSVLPLFCARVTRDASRPRPAPTLVGVTRGASRLRAATVPRRPEHAQTTPDSNVSRF